MSQDNGDGGGSNDGPFPFSSMYITAEGNATGEPKNFAQGDSPVVSLRMACNYRTRRGEEGVHFVSVVCFGIMAQHVLDSVHKGDRLLVSGTVEGRKWTSEGDGIERHDFVILADTIGGSFRFNGWKAEPRSLGGGRDPSRSYGGSGGSGNGSRTRSTRRREDGDGASSGSPAEESGPASRRTRRERSGDGDGGTASGTSPAGRRRSAVQVRGDANTEDEWQE